MNLQSAVRLSALVLCLLPALGRARVVLVVSSQDPFYLEVASSFKQNFAGAFEEYNLRGLEDEARKLGKDLTGNPPKLLMVVGNLAAKTAQEYCPNSTIVHAAASNASGLKFNERKVLGVSDSPSVSRLVESINLVFPGSTRVGLVYNPQFVSREVAELEKLAGKHGLTVKAVPVTEIRQIPASLSQLLPEIDLYLMFNDPGVINADTFPFIFLACFQKKIPVFATHQSMVKSGAIAGLSADSGSVGRELARLAGLAAMQKFPPERVVYAEGRLYLNPQIASAANITLPPLLKDKAVLIP